jgi:pimeloyl-ACP methyl ester carboxylesterase
MASDDVVTVGGVEIEILRRGSGKPILLLPGEDMLEADSAFVAGLAKNAEIIIASPPGFGRSARPEWMTQPADQAYVLLSLLKKLGLSRVPVIGCSFGGWVAAEMAVMDDDRFSRMALIGPYGVKLGGATESDFADIYQIGPVKSAALKFREPDKMKRDFAALNDEQLTRIARDLESFARFGWEPYLHNPKLKHLLYRVTAPTLIMWGEKDGMASVDYARGYAKLIPGARVATIADAAHYPHIEEPDAVLRQITEFLGDAK